ncbi:MAG: type III pantothenate kinase [Thiogranum sp.]|nr:type III pantothenate kinase [Thiogranum sp.]
MNLFLDVGNSRIKWATQEQENWTYGAPLVHKGQTIKDIAEAAWKELEKPERIVISNVAGPAVEKRLTAWFKKSWKILPEYVRPQASFLGVHNAYNKPESLGGDRWAALLAAHAHYSGTVMIVNCGTAITVDMLSADGRHLGGLIVPGIDLMAAALQQNTAGIVPGELDERDVALLGSSTEAAVSGGVLYAAVAFVDRVSSDFQAEFPDRISLILSGGDAQRIMPLLSRRPRYDEHLVLKGLAVYAEESVECAT